MRASTICPALILAASRKDKVIGRTPILVVSIKTRKGFSHLGAPPGNKPARKAVGKKAAPEIRRDSHIGSAKVNVKNRWLDNLKT